MSLPEPTPATQRVRTWRTLVLACFAVGLIVASAASGSIAAVLVVAGVLGCIGGGLAVLRGRSDVYGIRSRRGAAAVLALSVAGLALGGTAVGAPLTPRDAMAGSSVTLLTAPALHAAAPKTALGLLATLPVKGRAPMTGYLRTTVFGKAWLDVDRNGCDTRDDVLRRDLVHVTAGRCKVTAGVLHDPYTGRTIHFHRGAGTSTAVQIDHLVPLGDAWQTGAQRLSQAQRVDLANDPINLLAVDGPTNESKGDGDAATWLPKQKSFRCTYVAHQVGVKSAYGLWVTKAERAAMQRVLTTCPHQVAPVSKVAHLVPPGTSTRPTASPAPSSKPTATATAVPVSTPSAAPSTASVADPVHPGAFCSEAGATGYTAAGTLEVCRTSPTDERLRWRRPA